MIVKHVFVFFLLYCLCQLVVLTDPSHLIVLVHGWLGNTLDLRNVESSFTAASKDVVILRSSSNSFLKTMDGLESGGARLANEITDFKFKHSGLKSISFVSHSMGGIYSRYVIHLLHDYKQSTIAGLAPLSFITLATPHTSVRTKVLPANTLISYLFESIKGIAGESVSQLLLLDSVCTDPKICSLPLLVKMATLDEYVRPLLLFPNRRLYGNLMHDMHVSLPTSLALPHHSPFLLSLHNSSSKSESTPNIVNQFYSKGSVKSHTSIPNFNYSDVHNSTLNRNIENFLATRLDSIGFDRVVCLFHQPALYPFPLAHNKIAWIYRDPVTNWVTSEGKNIVDHLVAYVLGKHQQPSVSSSDRNVMHEVDL